MSCSNQPNTNDSLGGAAQEGTVTPMVVGIIVGTVIVFIIVVCALFYCVKLENHRYMAKVEGEGESELPAAPPGGGGAGGGAQQHFEEQQVEGRHSQDMRDVSREMSVKSRPSSSVTQVVVVAPQPAAGGQEGVREVEQVAGSGKKKLMFGWGKRARNSGEWQHTNPLLCSFCPLEYDVLVLTLFSLQCLRPTLCP